MHKGTAAANEPARRPIVTNYPGGRSGFCATREGALIAAFTHLVRGEATRVTITHRDAPTKHGADVIAWLHRTAHGVTVAIPSARRLAVVARRAA